MLTPPEKKSLCRDEYSREKDVQIIKTDARVSSLEGGAKLHKNALRNGQGEGFGFVELAAENIQAFRDLEIRAF